MASQALANLGKAAGRSGGDWRDLFGALAQRRAREEQRQFERNRVLAQMQNNAAARAFERRMQQLRQKYRERQASQNRQIELLNTRLKAATTPGVNLGPPVTSPEADPMSMESMGDLVMGRQQSDRGQFLGMAGETPLYFNREQAVGTQQDETLMPWEEEGFGSREGYLRWLRQEQAATTSPRGGGGGGLPAYRMDEGEWMDRLTEMYGPNIEMGREGWEIPKGRIPVLARRLASGDMDPSELPGQGDRSLIPEGGMPGIAYPDEAVGDGTQEAGGGGTDFSGVMDAIGGMGLTGLGPFEPEPTDPSRTRREGEFDRDLDTVHDSLDREPRGQLQGPADVSRDTSEQARTLPADSTIQNQADRLVDHYGSAQAALDELAGRDGLTAAERQVLSRLRGMAGGG